MVLSFGLIVSISFTLLVAALLVYYIRSTVYTVEKQVQSLFDFVKSEAERTKEISDNQTQGAIGNGGVSQNAQIQTITNISSMPENQIVSLAQLEEDSDDYTSDSDESGEETEEDSGEETEEGDEETEEESGEETEEESEEVSESQQAIEKMLETQIVEAVSESITAENVEDDEESEEDESDIEDLSSLVDEIEKIEISDDESDAELTTTQETKPVSIETSTDIMNIDDYSLDNNKKLLSLFDSSAAATSPKNSLLSPAEKNEYKKFKVDQLRQLIASKGLHSEPKKLKKNELLELIFNA